MKRRSGFTLLEMVLAMSIGLVLLFAVYMTMDGQLTLAQASRDNVTEATLARILLARIAQDVQNTLPAVDPRSTGTSGSSTTTTTTTDTTASATTQNSSMTVDASVPAFNVGVYGYENYVVLATSRMPRELLARDKLKLAANSLPCVSDLRRVSYWMADMGDGNLGLARQEISHVTSSDASRVPPDVDNPQQYLFAKEVRNIKFEYYDGQTMNSEWIGSEVNDVGAVRGPPAAIAVTLTMGPVGGPQRTYRQVIALPAGNNYPLP